MQNLCYDCQCLEKLIIKFEYNKSNLTPKQDSDWHDSVMEWVKRRNTNHC
jgi:hypothetical protein